MKGMHGEATREQHTAKQMERAGMEDPPFMGMGGGKGKNADPGGPMFTPEGLRGGGSRMPQGARSDRRQ